jgi:hypothetical protein
VYVIVEEGGALTAQPRIVTTGASRDGRIAILEGLEGDEQIVTAGQNKLYRGAAVSIDNSVQF